MRRNGNGGKAGNGGSEPVPRWVRTLFDQHETRMAQIERAREEMRSDHEARMADHEARMAAHEERMDDLQRLILGVQREEMETRRQTREIIAVIARLDAQRAKEGRALVESLKDVRARVGRLERK